MFYAVQKRVLPNAYRLFTGDRWENALILKFLRDGDKSVAELMDIGKQFLGSKFFGVFNILKVMVQLPATKLEYWNVQKQKHVNLIHEKTGNSSGEAIPSGLPGDGLEHGEEDIVS
ncbi:uncharacterized protein LOC112190267 [Rosa chinensis]|uniref:uncharacterized protein LOC112190267 n=1 Tax=Rosa chinensis TaxID=74649 RepID=UPI001AD916EB|nr:uncharacterized protein LOC112190267 [Rosa chinensis]